MLSCRRVRLELSNFLDDTVDLQLRQEISAHLCSCEPCRSLHSELSIIISLGHEVGRLAKRAGAGPVPFDTVTARKIKG